ncbi:lipocalin family protein [Carboxylicivirga marina]|uniref:lipocalin family protein n=1 Tax=Carboxylicivirga marina TaxID=2800988 RepID=UPI002596EEFB|nr:lipocalin family protein [uncultured Carboxylicivirga sp.]
MVGLVFASCEKDETGIDASKEDLLGKWTLVSTTETIMGETETTTDLDETIEFMEDDAYTMTFEGELDEEGIYEVSGNKLTLISEYDEGELTIFNLSADSFTMGGSFSEEFMGQEMSISFKAEYARINE